MTRQDEPEDVLSSIRRLVGEADPGDGAPLPILLLGPAVRVAEASDPFEMIHRRAHEGRPANGRGEVRPASGLAEATRVGAADGGRPDDARPDDARPDGARPDDAALRALVAEVVREELAGELGQRITRNLRQLVLREMRALGGKAGAETGAETEPTP